MNDWFTKDRSETSANRMPDRASLYNPSITVANPALGVNVYSGAITEEQGKSYIDTLERNLSGGGRYSWNGARVTSSAEVDLQARNAQDFKTNSTGLGPRNEHNAELYDVHEAVFQAVKQCVDDYGHYWGVGIASYEAFNFVKYDGPGTHFKVHADHGPTYVCTISVVVYLNDDYEGGDIWFPRMNNLSIKPKAGDIVVFPSTYIYEHASQDMISGVKYSVVIMTDYNDRDDVNHRVSPIIQDYKLKY
jgi:predicted 2-oxoglutarate/Fe(II)-dependent dioxygenase YbiX